MDVGIYVYAWVGVVCFGACVSGPGFIIPSLTSYYPLMYYLFQLHSHTSSGDGGVRCSVPSHLCRCLRHTLPHPLSFSLLSVSGQRVDSSSNPLGRVPRVHAGDITSVAFHSGSDPFPEALTQREAPVPSGVLTQVFPTQRGSTPVHIQCGTPVPSEGGNSDDPHSRWERPAPPAGAGL